MSIIKRINKKVAPEVVIKLYLVYDALFWILTILAVRQWFEVHIAVKISVIVLLVFLLALAADANRNTETGSLRNFKYFVWSTIPEAVLLLIA